MRIVIIYDHRRTEKLPLFQEELKRQGISEYEIFPAVVLNHDVVESISESFKEVIRSAKKNGDKQICIMEDDIWFPNEKGWEYYLKNMPEDFDVYLGGTYLIENTVEYKAPNAKIRQWIGNHCITICERYYDTWLMTDSGLHCDSAQKDLGQFYVCCPFPALQRSNSWSANNKTYVDYNNSKVLPQELIYK